MGTLQWAHLILIAVNIIVLVVFFLDRRCLQDMMAFSNRELKNEMGSIDLSMARNLVQFKRDIVTELKPKRRKTTKKKKTKKRAKKKTT